MVLLTILCVPVDNFEVGESADIEVQSDDTLLGLLESLLEHFVGHINDEILPVGVVSACVGVSTWSSSGKFLFSTST